MVGALVVLGAGAAGSGLGSDGPAGPTVRAGLGQARAHMVQPSYETQLLHSQAEAGATSHPISVTDSIADVVEDCPTVEDALARIAIITEGAEIADIVVALTQVQAHPATSSEGEALLAQQLRDDLRLNASPPCAAASEAVNEALRLARVAQDTVETAALNPDDPQSWFSDDRSGIATGASVSGYN